jgi:TetR/AcrR family transcriptional regulator, transcriptional repressor of aconitase
VRQFSCSFATPIREIEGLAKLLARDVPAPELLFLIRDSEAWRGSDFDFGLLSAEFQLQACRDKTFAKTYAKLHRTHRDTMAGLITKLFAKLDRIPPTDRKRLFLAVWTRSGFCAG